jgi:hypothetical protein
MRRGRPETGSFERDQENERKRILRFITSNNLSQPLIRAADRVNHYSASGRRASSVASDIDCCLAVWFTWIVEFHCFPLKPKISKIPVYSEIFFFKLVPKPWLKHTVAIPLWRYQVDKSFNYCINNPNFNNSQLLFEGVISFPSLLL